MRYLPMANKSDFNSSPPRSFLKRENMYLLFNSVIMNLLLNINWGRNRRFSFTIFVVWSTLVGGGCVLVGVLLVAWSRKSCLGPTEIASFVFLVLFEDV